MQTADFFRARRDGMIDLKLPLALLATRLPWAQLEADLVPTWRRQACDSVLVDGGHLLTERGGTLVAAGVSVSGRSRLSIRLLCSPVYLKHALNLSDEALMERWSQNVVWQHFRGLDYYEPRLPCELTQIGRFRSAIGEAGMRAILKATIDTAIDVKAIKPAEFERVIVDTTVQEKAVAYPVDPRLLEIARYKIVTHAQRLGIALRQTFAIEGKTLRRNGGGCAHAKQFKRLARTVKRQRTIIGKLTREVRGKREARAFNGSISPLGL